jgi:hypothetical protein
VVPRPWAAAAPVAKSVTMATAIEMRFILICTLSMRSVDRLAAGCQTAVHLERWRPYACPRLT